MRRSHILQQARLGVGGASIVNALLERLGHWVTRHRWWVLGVWMVVLVGLLGANRLAGGDYVNDYTVPGSESSDGLDLLERDFSAASGYSGQIVFHAEGGQKISDHESAIKQVVGSIRALDHVINATDPLSQQGTPDVSKND